MSKNQDRYDDLDNLITSLNMLEDEIEDENFKVRIQEIKWDAQNEFEEVKQALEKEQEEEYRQQERDYIEGTI